MQTRSIRAGGHKLDPMDDRSGRRNSCGQVRLSWVEAFPEKVSFINYMSMIPLWGYLCIHVSASFDEGNGTLAGQFAHPVVFVTWQDFSFRRAGVVGIALVPGTGTLAGPLAHVVNCGIDIALDERTRAVAGPVAHRVRLVLMDL